MSEYNAFDDFVARYRKNPVLFVQEVLVCEPDPWQKELMMAIASGERRCSVASGHGIGKSTGTSWLMLWFLLTRFPVKVVVTAPTSSQLFDALFAELKRWIREMPEALQQLINVKSDRVELIAAPSEAFIAAKTSRRDNPESLQGVHSDHVLLCADEASGIPEAVFQASAGSMSGEHAHTILLGNPTRGSGFFYDTHHRLKKNWWTRTVSCLDSPRVSEEYIQEMRDRYSEGSNAWRTRVTGEFPISDDDTVIPMYLVDAAMARDNVAMEGVSSTWGIDIARMGDDASVLVKRTGRVVTEIRVWRKLDLMQLSGMIKAEYDALPASEQPTHLYIDSSGLGAGVLDRCLEWGLPSVGVNVSESPSMGSQYLNLRAELWFKMKSWFEARDCTLPRDEDLLAELVGPKYAFTPSGKIKIESKSDMKNRGMKSPDRADALMLSLAQDAAIGIHGSMASNKWNAPLRRNLQGVA